MNKEELRQQLRYFLVKKGWAHRTYEDGEEAMLNEDGMNDGHEELMLEFAHQALEQGARMEREKIASTAKKAVEWYRENQGDEDYCYDMAWEQLSNLSRGDALDLLKALTKTEGKE